MRPLKINTILMFAALVASFGLGCKKPQENIVYKVNANVLQYTMLVKVDDPAVPNKYPENATVEIAGNDAALVYGIDGKKKVTVQKGMLSLALSPDAMPTDTDPIEFNVKISAPGYLPVNKSITVTKNQMRQTINVSMVNISVPPPGVSAAKTSQPLVNNTVANNITIATPLSGGKSEYCKIVVPQGVIFQDASGNPISGSSLDVTMLHYDTRKPQSLVLFPGGFSSNNVKGANGKIGSTSFMTVGFTSIDMSVGGVEVKKFSKPVSVTISVDKTIKNPYTRQPLAVGDVVPVWSYEESTGQWQYESNAQVANTNGEYTITFDAKHLSDFTPSFITNGMMPKLGEPIDLPQVCASSVSFSGVSEAQAEDLIIVDIYMDTWELYPLTTGTRTTASETIGNITSISGLKWNVKVYQPDEEGPWKYGGWFYREKLPVVGSGQINGCSPVTIPLTLAPKEMITLDLKGVCSNDNKEIRPSFYLEYKEAGEEYYSELGYVEDGRISTSKVKMGRTYDFYTYYSDQDVKVTRKIEQKNYVETITLKGSICK